MKETAVKLYLNDDDYINCAIFTVAVFFAHFYWNWTTWTRSVWIARETSCSYTVVCTIPNGHDW